MMFTIKKKENPFVLGGVVFFFDCKHMSSTSKMRLVGMTQPIAALAGELAEHGV